MKIMYRKQHYRGVKKRNYEYLIKIALEEFEQGKLLSITELAEKANISRTTAYRYFSSQNDLISVVVETLLEPIFNWQSTSNDAELNICDFLAFALPKMLQHEGVLRTALQISLQQWAQEKTSQEQQKDRYIRGNRKEILCRILLPLERHLPSELYSNVIYALSIIYGSEVFMVLKDIWNLNNEKIVSVCQWIAKAIINQAKLESKHINLKLPS